MTITNPEKKTENDAFVTRQRLMKQEHLQGVVARYNRTGRKRWRPRKMWLDNIKEWIRMSIDDLVDPIQYRSQWRMRRPFVLFDDGIEWDILLIGVCLLMYTCEIMNTTRRCIGYRRWGELAEMCVDCLHISPLDNE